MKNPFSKIKHTKWLLIFIAVFLVYVFIPIPKISNPTSTVIKSSEGLLMGAKIAEDGQWRFPGLDSIPSKMDACIRLFEDEHFYNHLGINLLSIFRAIKQNINAGKIVSGGSTITMQLLRIICGNKERNYLQKLYEIVLSTKYELLYSKHEILKMYLDNAPFGGNVVGVEAAAWRYYGRSPFQLSWAESATLAVLPNAPALIYPGKEHDLLLRKRNRLLKKLYDKKYITDLDYELALLEHIPSKPHNLPNKAPHLLERFAHNSKGKQLHSSLKFNLQKKINEIVNLHHNRIVHNKIFNVATLVVDNQTKKVIAYIGNTQNKDSEHGSDVDIINAGRSTGSILKPLLFASMITDGYLLPDMLVADVPTQLMGFTPKNYTLTYDGAVPAKQALSRSLNIPAVRMLRKYGVAKFLEYLKKLQIKHINRSSDHYGLSLILGGAEASLWDLVNVYSSMAGIANNYAKNSSRYQKNAWKKCDYQNTSNNKNNDVALNNEYDIFSASAIYSTFQALLEVNRPETETGWEMFSFSRKIAWKTGTSFGFRDAWAIGTTPEFTVGVWVGNADGEGRPGLTGSSVAAPIMFEIFECLPATSFFKKPFDDMHKLAICKESGFPASPNCEHVDTIWVSNQANKTGICQFHKIIHLDSTGMYQVNSKCYPQQYMKHKSWFVLPPSWEWYFRNRNPFYRKLPPYSPDCLSNNSIAMMEFLYPSTSTNIYVPFDIDGNKSEVVFKIVHREPNIKIFWHLDKEFIGTTEHFHEKGIQAETGQHIMTAVDEFGNTISKRFFVVDKKK